MMDYRGTTIEVGSRVEYCGPDFGFWQGKVTETHHLFLRVLRDGESYPRMVRPNHVVVLDGSEETEHDI